MQRRSLGVLLVTGVIACGGGTPPAPAPKPTHDVAPAPAARRDAEPPLTSLRTGEIKPTHEAKPLELEAVTRFVGPEFETLLLRFETPRHKNLEGRDAVHVPGATLAFVGTDIGEHGTLWVRRPIQEAKGLISGSVFTRAEPPPGIRFDLRQRPMATALPSKPALEADFLRALAATQERDYSASEPYLAFAHRRLLAMAAKKRPEPHGVTVPRTHFPQTNTLLRVMDTTTGRAQIQQSIQENYTLALDLAREPRKLPLSAAPALALPRADYGSMLAALGRTPPSEPLAAAAPADFWYLRSRTFASFLDLLELSESFGQPAADVLAGQSEDRGTTARYTAELALERTELARVLGPSVIESVAVVGSDPYVHDGTDVTFLFKLKAPPLFEAALGKALAAHASAHGGITKSEFVHEGVAIRVARSPDGRVRQHRASVAGLELVSNSPNAIRRVISTALGKAARLADEKDFQYLTARENGGPDETLGFLSDRFVVNAISPAQKIAQARRQLALAELSTPGYAALLFGYTHGRSPKDAAELVKSGELLANELEHADRSPIAWQPGKPAASRFGTTTVLEPLIELPGVEKISAAEQRAYAEFSSYYATLWSEYVDPVIVRFARKQGGAPHYELAIRALPLLRSDNRELIAMVGNARVEVPPLDSGLRWVLGLGKDAELRRELGRARLLGHSLKFDWLGDSIMVGVADRAELTRAASTLVGRRLEPPGGGQPRDELDAIADLPLYAVVEVKQRAGAVLALASLRKLADDVGRGMIEWRDGGKYRDIAITELGFVASGLFRDGAHVYYALCPKSLIFSLNRAVLEQLIDDELDGKSPRGAADARRVELGQSVVELGTKKDGALLRTLGWLIASELVARNESRRSAEAILRGAPESRASAEAFRTVARATFGHVPLTPDGNLYEYSVEGIRDPLRGTPYAPVYPPTPAPGSPLATLLGRFARVRTSIAFDTEPGLRAPARDPRSFYAKISLELR
jgi:hypothetical protein